VTPLKLRIEYFYDPESKNWSYRVPALQLVGGACETREELERHALDAIRYALSDEGAAETTGAVEAHYLELQPV
jgi:hypothetical protein